MDVKRDDLSNYDLDLSPVNGYGGSSKVLCVSSISNNPKDDCCKCFKKKGKGQKKMKKYLIPKGDVLEIPVTDKQTIT